MGQTKEKRGESSWHGSKAWIGSLRLGSSTEWVSPWVGDVEVRVGPAAVRQRCESEFERVESS